MVLMGDFSTELGDVFEGYNPSTKQKSISN